MCVEKRTHVKLKCYGLRNWASRNVTHIDPYRGIVCNLIDLDCRITVVYKNTELNRGLNNLNIGHSWVEIGKHVGESTTKCFCVLAPFMRFLAGNGFSASDFFSDLGYTTSTWGNTW